MKYFLIVGEASGDLHASNLMKSIKAEDGSAEFRFLGGDKMKSVDDSLIRHYRDMAVMGFTAVIINFPTIKRNFEYCCKQIEDFKPDTLVLVDYSGFNLKIAKFVKKNMPGILIQYYIAPKIWAWREERIKQLRKYIDKMYVILPFEVEYFNKKKFPVTYVGNPSVDSVSNFLNKSFDANVFIKSLGLSGEKKILAVLPGSRLNEIKRNLNVMIKAISQRTDIDVVIAGAPGVEENYYKRFVGEDVKIVFGQTYSLLRVSYAALVTSGTATLETALFRVPQVVCYDVSGGYIPNLLFSFVMKVKYISLVNLISNRKVVEELMGGRFGVSNIKKYLFPLLSESKERKIMLNDYDKMISLLGKAGTAENAAREIINETRNYQK